MARVKPEHRKDSSMVKTYEELLDDIRSFEGHYKTVVIDTCGALIDLDVYKRQVLVAPGGDFYSSTGNFPDLPINFFSSALTLRSTFFMSSSGGSSSGVIPRS